MVGEKYVDEASICEGTPAVDLPELPDFFQDAITRLVKSLA
jgi:hypothetical protein